MMTVIASSASFCKWWFKECCAFHLHLHTVRTGTVSVCSSHPHKPARLLTHHALSEHNPAQTGLCLKWNAMSITNCTGSVASLTRHPHIQTLQSTTLKWPDLSLFSHPAICKGSVSVLLHFLNFLQGAGYLCRDVAFLTAATPSPLRNGRWII